MYRDKWREKKSYRRSLENCNTRKMFWSMTADDQNHHVATPHWCDMAVVTCLCNVTLLWWHVFVTCDIVVVTWRMTCDSFWLQTHNRYHIANILMFRNGNVIICIMMELFSHKFCENDTSAFCERTLYHHCYNIVHTLQSK